MNYRIFMDTASKQFLANFEKKPELRPRVGNIITINKSSPSYVITRDEENTTSTTDPVSHDYFVRIQNTSPDSISMGKDIHNTIRAVRMAANGIY